jgi:hypothetical protein
MRARRAAVRDVEGEVVVVVVVDERPAGSPSELSESLWGQRRGRPMMAVGGRC